MNILHRIYAAILALPALVAAEVAKLSAEGAATLRADVFALRADVASIRGMLLAEPPTLPLSLAPKFLQPGQGSTIGNANGTTDTGSEGGQSADGDPAAEVQADPGAGDAGAGAGVDPQPAAAETAPQAA